MPNSNGDVDFASRPDAARYYTTLGLAVIPSYHPEPLPGRDQDGRQLFRCSCGDPQCPTPARHTIGALTVEQATTNTARVASWWLGMPQANIAMPAGRMCDVLELRYHTPADQVAVWLVARHVEPGPILQASPGRLLFLVRSAEPADSAERVALLKEGQVVWVAPETLILLPPSQTRSGHVTRWARPFATRTPLLPDAERLFDALAHLPTPAELDGWVRAQDADHPRAEP